MTIHIGKPSFLWENTQKMITATNYLRKYKDMRRTFANKQEAAEMCNAIQGMQI